MLNARYLCSLSFLALILGYDDLSTKKSAAQYKTNPSCPTCVATNALDRNSSTCTQTVMGITSDDKFTWWYVDLEDVHSVYNIRIKFRNYGQRYQLRQRGRFAGFSLFVSNTNEPTNGFLCYKNEPNLPPLDFSTDCITHGRYVIFYNERLDTTYPAGYEKSNVFTELCEVTVTGCSLSGVYGENCDKNCPENCQEQRCDIINGTCLSCTPGWLGERCEEACPSRYFGRKCESKCVGHCKDSKSCNHISGLCDNGCGDGWTGSNCTKECQSETYGADCVYNCSGNCFGDVTCNRATGRCDTGCNFGYTGELCETVDVESNTSNDNNCNVLSYIAGLSFLAIITIVLGIVCLIFMRKYYRLIRKARSPQYTSIIRTSQQPDNNSNDCQQYEELRIAVSENGYHNTEIRN